MFSAAVLGGIVRIRRVGVESKYSPELGRGFLLPAGWRTERGGIDTCCKNQGLFQVIGRFAWREDKVFNGVLSQANAQSLTTCVSSCSSNVFLFL